MLNLIVNILNGFIFQSIYVGYVYNKIKNVNYKSTYFIYLICYIIGATITSFNYSFIYYSMIIVSIMFYITYSIIHKEWKQITNFILMLNIHFVTSILTAIPILIFGYNSLYLLINFIMLITIMIICKKVNINKIYKIFIKNWNRTMNNKIKSVTIRNLSLILIYILITLINYFVNSYFIYIYSSLL